MQPLLKVSDVAQILAVSPGAARSWLTRKGVSVIQLGRGRGLGTRYRREEVEAAISEATVTVLQTEKAAPRRLSLDSRPLVGRTMTEQLALVRGGRLQ